uniref:IMP-specific 5'-nucleotidase 1 n=1 Tax=Bionectria ochroleuca TaxID=29856 RepID=A0A8H7K418_BIOOC
MTTRYRVEYALKTHRRDQFIEWVKGLLAVPFVLYSEPTGVFGDGTNVDRMAEESHRRYAEIMRDVERMIDDHMTIQGHDEAFPSKLLMLVPTAGPFFTRLPLEAAFKYQDRKRHISSRRYVAPSFNDVRLVLNSAQLMAVTGAPSSWPRLMVMSPCTTTGRVWSRTVLSCRGFWTSSARTSRSASSQPRATPRQTGTTSASTACSTPSPPPRTSTRFRSRTSSSWAARQLPLRVLPSSPYRLAPVPRASWLTPEMAAWSEADITALLDVAESALKECVRTMKLPATTLRKDRAVGIIPTDPDTRIARESLEETVLVVQRILESHSSASPPPPAPASPPRGSSSRRRRRRRGNQPPRRGVPFCAFNGGRDVFVDIGDKSWGVTVCQQWFGAAGAAIRGENTLHVGDQFLSAGANDFKARRVGTTAWIASPAETVDLLDELADLMQKKLA